MTVTLELPHSIDLDHHLSDDVRARTPSAMKAMGRLLGDTSIVSLAGGMPHASLFPMSQATFTVPHPRTLGDVAGWTSGEGETLEVNLYKNRKGGAIDLAKGLQYGLSNGFEELIRPLHEMTAMVHKPPYADHTTVLTLGCTDGVAKTWTLFCEKGDNVLCEEFSFSASLNSGRARGITFHGVKVDGEGMDPEELDRIMSTWDVETQGKKPHLLYTIPCGQNPTGTVLSEARYGQIYTVCQKHDLIIMEDDPYFWLQFQHYTPNLADRAAGHAKHPLPPPTGNPADDDIEAILKPFNEYAGVKSFLSRDIDGRVVRLDTFSKFFAPGSRCGWVTSNSSFADRFLRVGETNTQTPNGLGQSVLASYFDPNVGWGMGGMLRWIWSVRREYERKRDFFCDNLAKFCDERYARTVPARGGMFQWVEINLENHPRFRRTTPAPANGPATNTVALIQELFDYFLKNRLLILPAAMFATYVDGTPNGPEGNIHDRCHYFRATYAGETSQIEVALEIFGRCLEEWFTTGDLPNGAAIAN